MTLDQLLHIRFPVIQGGMANVATGQFAADCAISGALGLIASGGLPSAEALRQEIRAARARIAAADTGAYHPVFGVNLMLMHPLSAEFVRVCAEEHVAAVTTGAGNPGPYMAELLEAGIKVMPVVSAPVLARRMEALGAFAVIAEGCESGGHVGEMTTMTLVPQCADAVSIPVIAAGGIADHRQFQAARALGACGVQIGTALLSSLECPIHENYKAALLKARGSDTVVTGRIGGTPVRVLKNRMSAEYVRQEKAGADRAALERFTLGSLRRAVYEGDILTGSLMAGQVCGQLSSIRPVREILASICGWEEHGGSGEPVHREDQASESRIGRSAGTDYAVNDRKAVE